VTPEEAIERHKRAKHEAAARLMEVMYKEGTPEAVVEAFEMVTLWTLAIEGYPIDIDTLTRMIKATDP